MFCKVNSRSEVAALITDCGYYGVLLEHDLAGVDIYGIRDELPWQHNLLACVVAVRQGAQAYLDYLVVRGDQRGKGTAAELLDGVRKELALQGVRVVHTCVSGENGAAAKLLMRHGARIGWPYINAVVELEEQDG